MEHLLSSGYNYDVAIVMTSHERQGASNHRQPDCLVNSSSRSTTKKIAKLRIIGSLWRESTGDRRIALAKGQ